MYKKVLIFAGTATNSREDETETALNSQIQIYGKIHVGVLSWSSMSIEIVTKIQFCTLDNLRRLIENLKLS